MPRRRSSNLPAATKLYLMVIRRKALTKYKFYEKERKFYMIQKEEFVERLAAKGYTKRDAATVLHDVLLTIEEAMAEGESIMFRGFGTFEVRNRKAREGVSPQNGERITIPAYRTAKFTVGKVLKRAVMEGKVPSKDEK